MLPTRIELVFYPYQGYVMPLYYESSILGTLGQIRTDTLLLLRQLPLPIGLQGLYTIYGGEGGIRTHGPTFVNRRFSKPLP